MNANDLYMKLHELLLAGVDLSAYDIRVQTCGNKYYRIESVAEIKHTGDVVLYVA